MKQEMLEWPRHLLVHIQIICISLQTDNHASTSPLSFYRPDDLPAANQQHQRTQCTSPDPLTINDILSQNAARDRLSPRQN